MQPRTQFHSHTTRQARAWRAAAALGAMLLAAGTARAQTHHAISFTPGTGNCAINQNQTLGWQFDVLTPITVNGMTWFDPNLDGLELAHEVGIWTPDGTLIANTHVTIPAGTGAPLDGIWRTITIPATSLPVGTGYIVGGYNGTHAECVRINVSQTVAAEINYVSAKFAAVNGSFERPLGFSGASNGFYGVGFRIREGLGTKYCSANPNSTGSPADISASGSASSSAGDLTLTSAPVPNQNGLFFHGNSQSSSTFGNGLLCAVGGLSRGAIVPGTGNVATYTYDNSGPKRDLSAFIGTTRHFQHWTRDPMGGGAQHNTSNGISIDIQP